jgi:hypothetical protein
MMSINSLIRIGQLSTYLSFETITKRVSALGLLTLAGSLAVGAGIGCLCYGYLKPKKPSQPQPAENSVIIKAPSTDLQPQQGESLPKAPQLPAPRIDPKTITMNAAMLAALLTIPPPINEKLD